MVFTLCISEEFKYDGFSPLLHHIWQLLRLMWIWSRQYLVNIVIFNGPWSVRSRIQHINMQSIYARALGPVLPVHEVDYLVLVSHTYDYGTWESVFKYIKIGKFVKKNIANRFSIEVILYFPFLEIFFCGRGKGQGSILEIFNKPHEVEIKPFC